MDQDINFNTNISTGPFDSNEKDNLSSECQEEVEYTPQKRFTRTTLYLLAMTISLLGNSAVIMIVRKNGRMRTLTHYLIVNMAVADLLVTIFHMPYKLQIQLTNRHAVVIGGPVGLLICKLVGYTQDVSIACSVLSLMSMAIDRFMVIVFPFKRITLLQRTRYVIISLWLVSFLVCSPLLYANRMEEYQGAFYCYEEWSPLFDPLTGGQNYTIMQFALFYAVPLFVITVLYTFLVFKVWKRSVPGQAAPGLRPHRTHSVAKKNLLKLLIIIVCVFAASWLPYHVIYFLQFSSDMYINCNVPETIMFYCLFVGHANSAINPCVYFVLHKEYRRGLAQLARQVCCLRDLNVCGCAVRRFFSFDLKAAAERNDYSEYPTSLAENKDKILDWNQVVTTRASPIQSCSTL